MSKIICGMTVSVDGFVAGPNQSLEKPFGEIPETFHSWMFDEPDQHKAELDSLNARAGAYIMGRNMFGPRGEEYDQTWKGWWGDNPPYHAPVFVLCEKPRDPIEMESGTTFIFVIEGIEAALEQAQAAAGDKDVAIAGGANVVNQYLAAGIIDELWLHTVPLTVGSGARLFENVPSLRLEPLECRGTKLVTHTKYKVVKD